MYLFTLSRRSSSEAESPVISESGIYSNAENYIQYI